MVNIESPAVTQGPPTLLDTASSWISVCMVFAVFGRIMEVFTPPAVVPPDDPCAAAVRVPEKSRGKPLAVAERGVEKLDFGLMN